MSAFYSFEDILLAGLMFLIFSHLLRAKKPPCKCGVVYPVRNNAPLEFLTGFTNTNALNMITLRESPPHPPLSPLGRGMG